MEAVKEALPIFQWVGNRDRMAQCLTLASRMALPNGHHELAVRWMGAASPVREEIHSVEYHLASPNIYDWWLPILREAVDPALFERAWAEGKQMTLDQAVESVLSELSA
jgi:hypothetical protein